MTNAEALANEKESLSKHIKLQIATNQGYQQLKYSHRS